MAAAAAAALLDELMGRNRNVLPNEKPKELNWEDPEVSLRGYRAPARNPRRFFREICISMVLPPSFTMIRAFLKK